MLIYHVLQFAHQFCWSTDSYNTNRHVGRVLQLCGFDIECEGSINVHVRLFEMVSVRRNWLNLLCKGRTHIVAVYCS